jgi:hypothetical protein
VLLWHRGFVDGRGRQLQFDVPAATRADVELGGDHRIGGCAVTDAGVHKPTRDRPAPVEQGLARRLGSDAVDEDDADVAYVCWRATVELDP